VEKGASLWASSKKCWQLLWANKLPQDVIPLSQEQKGHQHFSSASLQKGWKNESDTFQMGKGWLNHSSAGPWQVR